jgi:polysaccharide pyruvyl transferase WcaK-like protein
MPTGERAPRIGILGRFGSGNLGNEASLEVMLTRLCADVPEARLDALCSGPEELSRRRGIPAAPLHWLDRPRSIVGIHRRISTPVLVATGALVDAYRITRWVAEHDLVVLPGTGPFESTTYVRPWQMPWVLFWASMAGRMTGTDVWYVCVGASRPREVLTRWLLRGAAGLASYRSFRDQASKEAVAALGVDVTADPVYPDLVWSLAVPSTRPPRRQPPQGRVIGLGVMAYSPPAGVVDPEGQVALVDAWVTLARRLAERGHEVRVFYGDEEDRRVARTVARAAPEASCVEVTETAELMDELAAMDFVFATRFHNVLCALVAGRPTISIGYGRKHRDLMAMIGMPDLAFDLEDLREGRVNQVALTVDADPGLFADRLDHVRREMVRALEPQMQAVVHASAGDRSASPVVKRDPS